MGAQRMNSMMPLLLKKAEAGPGYDGDGIDGILGMMMFMSSGEAGVDTAAMLPLLMEEMLFEEGKLSFRAYFVKIKVASITIRSFFSGL